MKPGMAWPVGVAVILGVTVAANIWVMKVANADRRSRSSRIITGRR